MTYRFFCSLFNSFLNIIHNVQSAIPPKNSLAPYNAFTVHRQVGIPTESSPTHFHHFTPAIVIGNHVILFEINNLYPVYLKTSKMIQKHQYGKYRDRLRIKMSYHNFGDSFVFALTDSSVFCRAFCGGRCGSATLQVV